MKAIAVLKEVQSGVDRGKPDIGTGWTSFVHIGDLPGSYAAVVICGTGPQLLAIGNHANCIFGLQVTGSGVRWAELDVPVPAGIRTKINVWRTANSLAPIGAGVTLLQVIKFAANHFNYGSHDVWDAP